MRLHQMKDRDSESSLVRKTMKVAIVMLVVRRIEKGEEELAVIPQL